MEFHGAKIALIYEDQLVMQLRDDKPGLFNANMWDFPGGGREGDESPYECARREVQEELGIKLEIDQYHWKKEYPAQKDPSARAYFFVANVSKEQFDSIVFGDEGQRWDLIKIKDFFEDDQVIADLKIKLQDYLDDLEN